MSIANSRDRTVAAPVEAAGALPAAPDKEFMATLAKGLAVLAAFGRQRPTMTLSEAAAAADLSRAAARRVLRTLAELGYVAQNGRQFALAPKILDLGFGYLTSQSWIDRAQPLLKDLSERLHESSSAAILQGTEIVYVARVPTRRVMENVLTVGSHLPAFHTALGRSLLGFLDDAEVWRRLRATRIEAYTRSTIIDPQALLERVRADRDQGFSIVDEELESGLRSIAVPVVDRDGEALGAVDISTHAQRVTRGELRESFLPALRSTAAEIGQAG